VEIRCKLAKRTIISRRARAKIDFPMKKKNTDDKNGL